MRSSLDGKFRYSVIFAVPALAITASTPTAWVPSRLNSSYAARLTRSRPDSLATGDGLPVFVGSGIAVGNLFR